MDIRSWAPIGALFLGFAVMLGAFGAHGLRNRLDAYSLDIYEKAVFYHFIHALGILIVPLLARTDLLDGNRAGWVASLLLIGILVFSGSLYALALTGAKGLGSITPIGGPCFIGAWILLAYSLMDRT
jgi:uncharacterized membrane protein YgdD (TMEM256/DUF423 family)